jgi:hypothetical protein
MQRVRVDVEVVDVCGAIDCEAIQGATEPALGQAGQNQTAEAMRVSGEGMAWQHCRCMKPMDVPHEPS